MTDDPKLTRKDFLKKGLWSLAGAALSKVEETVAPLRRRAFLRPPGAQPEALFLAMCTRCDACTAACPHEAISVQYGAGPPHDGTPALMNLRDNPCLLCEDTPCIAACPTDALHTVESVKHINIGTAYLDTLTCSAYRGSGCRVCYDVCPIRDEAILLTEGLPQVVADACTGCGICQRHCPEEPAAIQVFPNP